MPAAHQPDPEAPAPTNDGAEAPESTPGTSTEERRVQSTAAQRTVFAAAGLPVPQYDRTVLRLERTQWDSRIGLATHRVIGLIAPAALTTLPSDFGSLVRPVVAAEVRGRDLGRLDKARTRVTGLTVRYLREFLPAPDGEFLGAETPLRDSRPDLVWRVSGVGVWFDEIKTWRHTQPTLDTDTWAQVTRHLAAGTRTHGDLFAGVRLITLGNLNACIHVSPSGRIEELRDSPLHPTNLRIEAASTHLEPTSGIKAPAS